MRPLQIDAFGGELATDTSRKAYEKIAADLPARAADVFRIIVKYHRSEQYASWRKGFREFGDQNNLPGMTARDVAQHMGVGEHTISGRFTELKQCNMIVPGQRVTRRFMRWSEAKQCQVEDSSTAWGYLPTPIDGPTMRRVA